MQSRYISGFTFIADVTGKLESKARLTRIVDHVRYDTGNDGWVKEGAGLQIICCTGSMTVQGRKTHFIIPQMLKEENRAVFDALCHIFVTVAHAHTHTHTKHA